MVFIISYLVIALIVAIGVLFGEYTFNTWECLESKWYWIYESVAAISYGLAWPIWLIVILIDMITDLLN